MDIHARSEQNIRAFSYHLRALNGIELTNQLLIPCARKQRAYRQERRIGMKSYAGRAVRCSDGWHAFFAQGFEYSAVDRGIAGRAELAVHDIVAAAERLKLDILKLRRKARQGRPVVCDILELYSLVAREIGSFGQILLYLLAAQHGAQRYGFVSFSIFPFSSASATKRSKASLGAQSARLSRRCVTRSLGSVCTPISSQERTSVPT